MGSILRATGTCLPPVLAFRSMQWRGRPVSRQCADLPPTGGAVAGVYAELAPLPRHRAVVDHVFILRDRGALTGPGRSVFATPFREIALVAACPDARDGDPAEIAWQLLQVSPRFGRRPRAASLHGWMIGVRVDPLAAGLAALPRVLRDRTGSLGEIVVGEAACDAIVAWLDGVLDLVLGDVPDAGDGPAPRSRQREVAGSRHWALFGGAAPRPKTIARLADAGHVAPRTLQRHVRSRTGLAPKRYAALRRFNAALREVAGGEERFADVAVAAGYCDQSHMTADLARHAGSSPGRLRAFARRQRAAEAARLFADPAVRARITLLLAASAADSAMVDERR